MRRFITLCAVGITLCLAAPLHAAALTWDDGAGNDNWSSGTNWNPDTAPTNGDSVILTATAQSRLDYAWIIESGQSLTSSTSGVGDELVLQSSSDLTLATGGTMDIGFMRPRFSSGGRFTIEPGASLNTDNYGLGSTAATITFEANAAGVTTWNNTGNFQMGSDNLVIDLSNYDIANGTTLILVDYNVVGDLAGQTFASVTVTGGYGGTLEYTYDQGGGDVTIALTDIQRVLTWDDGAGDDNWSSASNWDPNQIPTDGDSAVLTPTAQSRMNLAWTIESGRSLTSTSSGFGDELVLQSGGDLTLATGGTMDIGFMRPRFSSGGQFTIEPGASLDTDNYGLGSIAATITFEANATGVTTWNCTGNFDVGSDNLTVDLTNYDVSNGTTLVLVDYGTQSGTFGSVTLTPSNWRGTLDYAYDQGSGDLAIALTNIYSATGAVILVR